MASPRAARFADLLLGVAGGVFVVAGLGFVMFGVVARGIPAERLATIPTAWMVPLFMPLGFRYVVMGAGTIAIAEGLRRGKPWTLWVACASWVWAVGTAAWLFGTLDAGTLLFGLVLLGVDVAVLRNLVQTRRASMAGRHPPAGG